MVEGDGLSALFECSIEGTVEMELEQADTADTACIQKFPVLLCQKRLFLDRQLSLQSPQNAFEYQTVFFLGHIIAREVNIDTPAGQLWIDFTEGSHFIGPDQDMADSRGILKVFEMI